MISLCIASPARRSRSSSISDFDYLPYNELLISSDTPSQALSDRSINISSRTSSFGGCTSGNLGIPPLRHRHSDPTLSKRSEVYKKSNETNGSIGSSNAGGSGIASEPSGRMKFSFLDSTSIADGGAGIAESTGGLRGNGMGVGGVRGDSPRSDRHSTPSSPVREEEETKK